MMVNWRSDNGTTGDDDGAVEYYRGNDNTKKKQQSNKQLTYNFDNSHDTWCGLDWTKLNRATDQNISSLKSGLDSEELWHY